MRVAGIILALCFCVAAFAQDWLGYGKNPQHTALSDVAAQPLERIFWSTPVDLNPQYSGSSLLIHYGSMLITPSNTVIVTVKTGATDGFRVEGRSGTDGSLTWTQDTNYSVPTASWIPSCGCTLTSNSRVAIPAGGGTILVRTNPDSPSGTATRMAFYGITSYNLNQATYNANVKINTPIMCDSNNNLYFGFLVSGSTPTNLISGIARISAGGIGTWVSAATASNDNTMTRVSINCAPALSADESIVYVGVRNNNGHGYLVGMNASNLSFHYRIRCLDPVSGSDALISGLGTASPTVAPDGDVYYGVLDNGSNTHGRGYLLHYNSILTQTKTPGAFGWDDTASIVPAAAVPSYSGPSPYLLLTKYNNYLEGGGDGHNRLAVLDPASTMFDPISGATVMGEVITVAGVTHDPRGGPEAVTEWCINTAAVDAFTKSALVGNEDGVLYRWDFTTNSLSEMVRLTDGLGEAYTPTAVAPDGTVYAINNAIMFAVGTSRVDVESFSLARGIVISGGLPQLLNSDNMYLVMRPGVVLSSTEEPIQLILNGTASDATATSMKFRVEASVNQANLSQRIYLFNYTANAWVQLDSRAATLTDSVVQVTAPTPQQFLETGTNHVKARVSYKAIGPILSYPWQARVDQVYWNIVP